MNRPIKFRALDKKEKRMFNVMELGFQFDTERYNYTAIAILDGRWGKINGLDRFGQRQGYSWNGQERDLEDLELMQFTGLKDKNGKEIYEDDIVRTYKPMASGFGDNNIAIVKWIEYDAKFLFRCKGLGAQDPTGNCEVIGNIYENPELIKT